MSCNACTRRFGLFCKESGCPNCGYSFCGKCLKKEIAVPRCNNSKMKVCLRCFEKLEQSVLSIPKTSSPELLLIDEPPTNLVAPIEPLHVAEEALPDEDKEIANNLDNVISKKLQNLKDDGSKGLPSDVDMASRLAALKGVPYKEYSKADILLSTDNRTDKEKIDDLLKQFVEEQDIDKETPNQPSNPLADIERRLAALKEDKSVPSTSKTDTSNTGMNTPSDNDENEEEAAVKVIERFMSEVKLPDIPITSEEQELIAGLPAPSADTEELPWCTICNEDAVTRCFGCDGELFCGTCFKECHEDEDFREHKTEAYSKHPNFKENHFSS